MRVAALDLGTNTFLLLIADVDSSGRVTQVVSDNARVVRLGQGVHASRRFHPEALARAEACFNEYSQLINQFDVDKVQGYATSAARDVQNSDELLALGRKYSIPIEIISGEREAECTYFGAVPEDLPGQVIIIDVGGGSTEIICGDKSGIQKKRSLDMGAVRLTELFITGHPIAAAELAKMRGEIEAQLKTVRDEFVDVLKTDQQPRVLAVGGTPTTLASIDMELPFESDRVDGYQLSVSKLQKLIALLAAQSVPERQKMAGMEPKRADVIVAGALILTLVAECFTKGSLEVSIRGVRFGMAKSLGKSAGR
jgi:exopolyphosphatase/guanosine-5'-triphosphate,3'-diphosphate pyrophosphatase